MDIGWGPNTQASSVLPGHAARADATARTSRRRLAGRRCADDQHAVHALVAEERPQRPLEVVGAGLEPQVDGAGPHPRRRPGPEVPGVQLPAEAGPQLGQLQPGVDAGVGRQRQGSAAIAHKRHPVAIGQGLARQHPGNVQQL